MSRLANKRSIDRLRGWPPYWNEERETMPPGQRDRLILERLKYQIEYAYHQLPFYRRHYDQSGFKPEMVKTLDDFTTKVPVITKKMLVESQAYKPPFGDYLGIDGSEIGRIHGSSGTSGQPTLYAVSKADWRRAGETSAMGLWCAGARPADRIQITFPFSLFFGGWGALQAAELIGATCFPAGATLGSERQIELLFKLETTLLWGTPSYVTHLGMTAAELGLDLSEASTSLIAVGGEPGGSIPSVRAHMRGLWGDLPVSDIAAGSTSEMYPFMANVGCLSQEGGVHLFQDENYTEVVSRDDPNMPIPPGTPGAVVATHLWRESQPMIRFWMGDEGILDESPCPCGRTYPRLPKGVFGRLDDMLLIRGANVYPSSIDAVVRAHAGAGEEYRIIVERPFELDELTVEVERSREASSDDDNQLRSGLMERLKHSLGVRVDVKITAAGTFEPQTFKARRVIDKRGT